jgi:hypothetical protein
VTLVETLVATALTLALSGTVLSLVVAGHAIARTQPETSDLQQRARVALQTIGAELRDAGAGLDRGPLAGPLVARFPPVAPSADGGVTIWTVTSRDAQASPEMAIAPGATVVTLHDNAGCLPAEPACAFSAGMSVMAFTSGGCRTVFRVASVTAAALQLAAPLSGCALDPGSAVAEADVHTFRVDLSARQLVRRDEATGSSAPVLDGVVSFTAAYFADAAGLDPISGVADADLMRARRIRLTIRFVASNPLLRIPDLTVAVDAAPANLGGG